ncbi:MAG: hypothetical protein WC141_09290 [Arcobacteraceae bacterium]
MKTIKVFSFLLIVTLNLSSNEGLQSGDNLRKHFGNIQSNVAQPLTSDTEFKTVDNSKSFKANLTCNETTKTFLEISYTGLSDISIHVSIDTNLNGVKNKNFTFHNISGVSTNGVVKCSPNTWNNCKYYTWKLSNDNLFLEETNLSGLGGAYCINSSCNSIAATQKINTLDTIGGAISSMFQNSNSKYLITKTLNNGNKIEFYGQNYDDCTNYQDSKPTGSIDSTAITNEQSNNENSVYYSLNKSVENHNQHNFKNDVSQSIEVKKNVSVEGDTSDYTFTYSGKQQNEDGTWSIRNDNAKVNIDFLNPNIKYCEIKFLEENTVVFSDNTTHHSSVGDKQTWNTKIVECTGTNYDVCPIDSTKGELLKNPCGEIDNFAETTSILMAVEEATDDFTCSL